MTASRRPGLGPDDLAIVSMTAYYTREHDSTVSDDVDADVGITLGAARRATIVDRLQAVVEPSSSVDHLLGYLTGARTAAQMTVVDWVLPLARTDGGIALVVARPDGATAYLGFVDGDFRATPWQDDPEAAADVDPSDHARVAPRDWFPEDARVVPLPVESTPFSA